MICSLIFPIQGAIVGGLHVLSMYNNEYITTKSKLHTFYICVGISFAVGIIMDADMIARKFI
jgi:hypothetical protein